MCSPAAALRGQQLGGDGGGPVAARTRWRWHAPAAMVVAAQRVGGAAARRGADVGGGASQVGRRLVAESTQFENLATLAVLFEVPDSAIAVRPADRSGGFSEQYRERFWRSVRTR